MSELRKNAEVDNLELFFDLIFAYAISRITTVLHLVHHETIPMQYLLEYFVMFFMFWTVWTYQTVLVNRFFKQTLSQKLFLVFDMFVVIILSQSLNANFATTHFTFVGSTTVLLLSIALQYGLRSRNLTDKKQLAVARGLQLILLISGVASLIALLPVGGYRVQFTIYVIAMIFANVAPIFMYRQLTEFPSMFEHLTERYSLFTLLLFGESIIAVASIVNVHHFDWLAILFFIMIVALFAVYFTTYQRGINRKQRTAGIMLINVHYFIFVGLDLVTAVTELYLQNELHGEFFAWLVTLGLAGFFAGVTLMQTAYPRVRREHERSRLLLAVLVASGLNGSLLMWLSRWQWAALLLIAVELLAIAAWWNQHLAATVVE